MMNDERMGPSSHPTIDDFLAFQRHDMRSRGARRVAARLYRQTPEISRPLAYLLWLAVDTFLVAYGLACEPVTKGTYRRIGFGALFIFAAMLPTGAAQGSTHGQREGFEVCNCEPRNLQYVKIDLTDTERCNDPEKDYEKPYKANVMVLQTDTREAVVVYNCQVRYSKRVEVCGYQHTSYGSLNVVREEEVKLTGEQCHKMAAEAQYQPDESLGGFPPLMDLQLGFWTTRDYYSHGMLYKDGRCEWDSWSFRGMAYKRSYEETTITARVRELRGLLNRATGKITINNGLTTDYAERVIVDGVEGTSVWKTEKENCTDSVSLIYRDNAVIHRKRASKRKSNDIFEDAMVVIENKETKQTGGFLLKADRDTCVPECHRTHINGLILCTDPHRIATKFKYLPGERPSVKNLQAVVSHFAINSEFRTNAKFEIMIREQCELNRDGVLHQLADLAGNENPYALRNLEIQGIGPRCRKYLPGGAVGYIASCKPMNVTRVSYPNCTREIPVTPLMARGNNTELLFADPITLVTQKFPTLMHCSPMMPVRWKIHDKWLCSTPAVHECDSPTRLDVNQNSVSVKAEVTDVSAYGNTFYSEEQMTENEAFLNSASYRLPVINNLVQGMTQKGAFSSRDGVHFTVPFDPAQIDNLSYQVATRILPMFSFIGSSYTIVVGVLFLAGGVKILVGIFLRLVHLHRRKGCGLWLITALWDTAFMVIGIPWKVVKSAYDMVMDGSEFIELDELDSDQQVLFLHEQIKKLVKAQEAGVRHNERMAKFVNDMAKTAGPYQSLALEVRNELDFSRISTPATAPVDPKV